MIWKILNEKVKVAEIVPLLMASRGIEKESKFHDPFLIPDMRRGAERILEAREKKEKVAIYGDYDADGVTATSILWKFLYRELGVDVIPYIPSRFDEGYGLNQEAIKSLIDQGINLIITVDCGIKDSEIIQKFSKQVDFVVTDHHTLPEDQNFPHIAIHPDRKDSKYPFRHLAGAGVSWKLICALSEKLNKAKNRKFDPYKYLDLACIGTVTDVMPLIGENRMIVKSGLERIRKGENPGLKALMKVAGRDITKTDTYNIGFVIGPRINAAGRMKDAMIAVKLFSTENEDAALKLAWYLNDLNIQRQQETQFMMDSALEQISHEDSFLFAYNENWNEGIVGLVAGKLKETFYKPAIAATKSNGLIVGSARSIEGINITEVIAQHESLLVRFGGHSQAAGLSFEETNMQNVKTQIAQYINENFREELFQRVLEIDMELDFSDLTLELYKQLKKLAPFGEGNQEPVFQFRDLKVVKIFKFGTDEKHLKLVVTDEKRKSFVEVLAFGKAEELSEITLNGKIDLAGRISLNEWNGQQKVQIVLIDAKIQ